MNILCESSLLDFIQFLRFNISRLAVTLLHLRSYISSQSLTLYTAYPSHKQNFIA